MLKIHYCSDLFQVILIKIQNRVTAVDACGLSVPLICNQEHYSISCYTFTIKTRGRRDDQQEVQLKLCSRTWTEE